MESARRKEGETREEAEAARSLGTYRPGGAGRRGVIGAVMRGGILGGIALGSPPLMRF